MWTKKYAPKSVKELVGDIRSIMQLEDFIKNFKNFKKNAVLIYGPTGSGKTEAAYAIAKENNLEVLEINASDFRNKEHILEIVGKSINQASLFGRGKLILIDEIDGLSGTKDRGGAQAVASLIEKTSFPIVMTANDPWQSKLSSIRRKSLMIEFGMLSYLDIFKVLKRIANSEGIDVDESILKSIANRAGGDVRSAINDFQLVAFKRKIIQKEDLDDLSDRGKEEDIHTLLRLVYKSKDPELILQTFDKTNLKFDELFLWIEENLPLEYKGVELSKAFDSLSKSDIFKGRIMSRQYWRFMVYQKYFMSVGVAISKSESKKGFVKYGAPQRILKLWKAKMKYAKKQAICEKIAGKCHISKKRSLKEVFPYSQLILKENADYLGLSEEEISWLN